LVIEISEVAVFLGLDVGKGEHHGRGLTPAGKTVFDMRLPNSEPKLRALFDKLSAKYGTVLVIVDQPANIGALPLAVARDAGCMVAYLPGLTMRRIADLYPGEAKTDARDAFIIADAARTMPHTLRALATSDETVAELDMARRFSCAKCRTAGGVTSASDTSWTARRLQRSKSASCWWIRRSCIAATCSAYRFSSGSLWALSVSLG
jgi:hypothetical protein